jgi:cytoskeletal protein RodZ
LRANAAVSTGKVRERRHVIAPQDAPAAQKSRRSGALVWLAVAALAAGVLVVVGLRGHRAPQPVAAEPQPAIEHPTTVLSNAVPVVESTPSAAPVPEASAQEVASAAPSVAAPSTAAATPTLANNSAKTLQPKAAPSEPAPAPKAEAAVAVAAVATEQPTAPSEPAAPKAPVVIHNALPPAAPGTEFDRSAAVSALKSAAVQASSCRKDGDPSGSATLTITFAPSGRVTSATIQGPPFAGTPTGGCIASMMRHAQIPSFDGDRVTVTKTVVIE